MAFKGGCNADMPQGSVGKNNKRVNPGKATRQNLSKGGVNDHIGGTTERAPKMDRKPGKASADNYGK